MSSFCMKQEFFVHNNPEAEAQRCYAHAAKRKPPIFEKTTSSVLSVISINL